MRIEELDVLPADAADAALRACADVDSWVEGLVAGRPYADAALLLDRAIHLAADWTEGEVDHALRDHPRIGEQPSASSATGGMSRAEQAGMATAGEDLTRRMAEGNAAYEARFGRIYLVRAAGRTAEELVDILEQRLGNDPATESLETKRQLAEIAVLRLRGLLSEDAA